MRRLRRIGLVLLILVAVVVAWEPSRVAIQTAVLLPNLLDAGPKPLTLFSDAPQRTSLPYRASEPGEDADLAELWLPSWASADRPAGAMLLVFGVNNLGRNHPVIERVAEALARTGVAVLVPDSRTLLEGRLEVGEIDGVVRAFQVLAARPEVDRTRVGIVGFSVGGSLALLAAGDPRIASQVRWVNAFGAFADASTYLAAVSAHAYRGTDGGTVPWTPTPLAREVFLRFMLDQVQDENDRRLLEEALGEQILAAQRPSSDAALRGSFETDAARSVHDLLTAPSLDEAESAIDALPAAALRFVDAISPGRHISDIRAEVHLMHETEDHHVPFVESRALASALESAGRLAAHTEFRLFDHVQPDDLDLVAAAPELVKLLLHLRSLLEETL
ncbi:MAG: acetylxylan esterase [Chloroflexota bacterium]|nr:acetylxylan esterase [Chloroflexota bacterium]